jgi:cytochrome c oxidase assembly protein subunit 15
MSRINWLGFFLVGCKIGMISLLLLILSGGIVRSSGSGMGCPDWPKCFNKWIPPTKIGELPEGYERSFLLKRIKKNERLAHILREIGLRNLASQVESDSEINKVEPFNAFNTWTEYLNRLVGVITGLLFVGIWIVSIPLYRYSPKLFWISSLNLILIFIQAYLGSLVVSTHLLPGLISLHMILALIIILLLVRLFWWAYSLLKYVEPEGYFSSWPYFKKIMVFAILLTSFQILLGARVRESFDLFSPINLIIESEFMKAAGSFFPLHRLTSIMVLLVNLYIVFYFRKFSKSEAGNFLTPIKNWMFLSLSLIGLQITLGISLELGALPPTSQALHIFVAILLFTSQIWTFYKLKAINHPVHLGKFVAV